ncbi:MAG: hypothetical protein ACQERK_01685 [Campylobacterota bacterium]
MFDSIKSVFSKKPVQTLIEQSDIEFSHRLLSNGLWLEGENKHNQRFITQKCIFEYLLKHQYPILFIATAQNPMNDLIEELVTAARQSRRYQKITSSMSSVNALNLKEAFQNKKIVHIDLQIFSDSDKKVVLERLNHQLKLFFSDLHVNFKAYEKKESLRGVIFIDHYDVKDFKVFTSTQYFETMRDYEIGYVFGVEKEFLSTSMNAHKEKLKDIKHFTFLQA